jgi:molecular chaperone HscB
MSAGAAKALTSSHFALFGLPEAFSLDQQMLEKAYRDIQSQVHPDRFAHAGDAERRASLQWTTRVNEAYRTLKSPVQRARHLLELHGVDVAFETNTAMPPDFLMQQMELRETLEEAKDEKALDALRAELTVTRKALEVEIADAIDDRKAYVEAATLVRKLQFLHRLDEEIDEAYE